jgi:mycothiol synthase
MGLTPQLRMLKPTLTDLPVMVLPEGAALRSYQAGDGAHWERILAASFGGEPGRFSFDRIMRRDLAFRPERVLFVVIDGVPVATASAWRAPGLIPDTGMVHFVGAMPEFQGRRLGYWVTLATLHRLAGEGLRAASLTTDDFRLPAIKTYLRLGFDPLLVHENQRERWQQVWRDLKLPDTDARLTAILSDPVWQPPAYPEDDVDYARALVRRRRQHPDRPAGGLAVGGSDGGADESLYHAALLGRAGASVSAVVAGTECPFELWFEAGPAGLPTGSEVRFCALGVGPFATPRRDAGPENVGPAPWRYAGSAQLGALQQPGPAPESGPPHKRLPATGAAEWGFVVERGTLAPGERVTLLCGGAAGGCRWTRRAGRLEIKVLINPGQGEPVMRLPEPVVILIGAGAPARVHAFLPGSARLGAALVASVLVTDSLGNPVSEDGRVRLRRGARAVTRPLSGGASDIDLGPMGTDPVSCRVSVPGLPAVRSNVAVPCDNAGRGLFFGDLSAALTTVAAGEIDAVYRRARRERRLDFVSALAQGPVWLDNECWALHKHAAEANLDEGRFVTFLGFAWQHSHYGEKSVHFLGGDQPYLPVDDPRYAYPARLYEALRATDALVIGRGPDGRSESPTPGTARAAIEPDVERLLGLGSGHAAGAVGAGAESRRRDARGEADALAALRAGLRVGFAGAAGAVGLEPDMDSLCAVWAESLTRRALFAALRARRTYALCGRRIALQFTVNGAPMGSELPFSTSRRIHLRAWAEERIVSVEVARDASPWRTLEPGKASVDLSLDEVLDRPAFYHAQVTLADGSRALCSPVWIG